MRLGQHHFGMCAVGRFGGSQESRLASGHAIGEEALAGPGDELGPRCHHHPKTLRDRAQGLLQVAGQRPPELVVVVVDHPVGSELEGKPRDLGPAAAPHLGELSRHPLEPQEARLLIALENLHGAVGGAVVGDHEHIDPLGVVVAQVGLDHIGGIANHQGHGELHDGGPIDVRRGSLG